MEDPNRAGSCTGRPGWDISAVRSPQRATDQAIFRGNPFPLKSSTEKLTVRQVGKLCVDSKLVPPGIYSIPTKFWQVNSVKTVQTIGCARFINAEPLITKPRRNPIRPKQSSQEVTLRVAVARAGRENFRPRTCYRIALKVSAVLDRIADPFKTAPDYFMNVGSAFCEFLGFRQYRRIGPVDNLRSS